MLRSWCRLAGATVRQGSAGEVLLQGRSRPAAAASRRPLGTLPIPINDLDLPSYSAEEAITRCKLAALYRLVHVRGWSMGIYNHITARISAGDERFLVNPFGLLYDEVTAANLVTLDLAGNVLDAGSSAAGVNLAGYVLHSAIHEARPDIMCAVHVHLPVAVAVSSMKCGLLPVTQEALIVHSMAGVSYHNYQGILVNTAERSDIQRNLGVNNKVLILRNHGVVVCGETVEEAYLLLDFFVIACQSQVAMMSAGVEGLTKISDVAFENMLKMKREAKGVDTKSIAEGRRMQFGQPDFEACMRKLDRAGFNTGYPYQRPELLGRQ